MDKNITRKPLNLALFASMVGTDLSDVVAVLKKASTVERAEATDFGKVMYIYLTKSDLPQPAKVHLAMTTLLSGQTAGYYPGMDISDEVLESLEAAQHEANLTTIAVIAQAQAAAA